MNCGAEFCAHCADDCVARRTCLIFTTTARTVTGGSDSGVVCFFRMTLGQCENASDHEEQTRELHRRLLWRGAALFASTADAQLDENAFEGAETGEGSLKKVESDKGREKQPELVHPVSEREPDQHERASNEIDDALSFHGGEMNGLEPSREVCSEAFMRFALEQRYAIHLAMLCIDCLKVTVCCARAAVSGCDKRSASHL